MGTWRLKDVEEAYREGEELGASHMLVAFDVFDDSNYPIYVMPGNDPYEAQPTNGDWVDECYRYRLGWEFQAAETRAFHWEWAEEGWAKVAAEQGRVRTKVGGRVQEARVDGVLPGQDKLWLRLSYQCPTRRQHISRRPVDVELV